MSRDPFEHLRESNPLPDDQPVYPPMGTADRIAGGPPRRSWPAWALAGAVALAVLVGGGGWLLWIRGGTQDVAATSVPTTATTAAPTTTAAPVFRTDDAVIYLFVDDDGTQLMPGPYLIPSARPYAVLSHPVTDPVMETLQFLLNGAVPGEQEASPALASAIPAGTRLLGVEVADGIATVDLSAEFTSGGGSLSMRGRLAQVVFTLTRFEEIDGVRFLVEGVPTTVFGGEGVTVEDPARRAGFEDLLPAVMIESPPYWASDGGNPLVASGTANVFEATVSLALRDQYGAVVWEGFTTATCGTGCRGDFEIEIPYEVDEAQLGTLVAWETSMEDGRRTNAREHQVWLVPSGTTTTLPPDLAALEARREEIDPALDGVLAELDDIDAQLVGLPLDQGTELRERAAAADQQAAALRSELSTIYDRLLSLGSDVVVPCSAEALGSELLGQPELPEAVADLRVAVYEAARACNWRALGELLSGAGDFSYSFGDTGDPVGYWQRQEFLHYQPMLYIAEMLRRPFGVIDNDGLPIYAWPSAHTYGSWAEVPEAEKEALRPLYDDLDFSVFEEFGGYLGYRIGITLDGEWAQWVYAIAGD
jgi:hypothetical protein